MRRQTFYNWLQREVSSSRMALVTLYENRDRLLYVEAPPLRKRYMDIFGAVEEPVLEAELEVSLLRRKVEMIQTALNRREPVDLAAIDARLQDERERQVSELEREDLTLNELPQLTEQQERRMQRQYREITNRFHPAVNTDITEAQRDLYQKAVEAYRMQDADEMAVIYDALFSPSGAGDLNLTLDAGETDPEGMRDAYREMATGLSTDYRLARKLYPCFAPLEEDRVVLEAIRGYEEQRKAAEDEIAQIRNGFPFNAVSTMDDRTKTEEYLAELRFRARQCEEEKTELEDRIAELTKGNTNV